MTRIPIVAIVGRQNVGKSSILNAMVGRRLAIVDPTPGVTRDRVSAIIAHGGKAFELVDTGGIGLRSGDPFYEEVERQIERAIEEADAILFVVDIQAGLTPLDRKVASRFRNKTGLLVANKADTGKLAEGVVEFFELGMGEAIPVSAAHRRGIGELVEKVADLLPPAETPEKGIRIAVVGKRNVGKSTFINTLAGEERVIVSETPGTTRDAVDVTIERDDRRFVFVDTAGLRKKGHEDDAVELFSSSRTEEAVRRADVVILMMDTTANITELDRRIAGVVDDLKKPAAVVLNKYDLVPKGYDTKEFAKYVGKMLPPLRYAPLLMISSKRKQRVWEVANVCSELHVQSGVKVPTAELNRALDAAVRYRSPSGRGPRSARIFYATQKGTHPPRFVIFVNSPKAFASDYVRYLEGRMRQFLPMKEVPIRLELRARRKKKKGR